MPFPTAIGGFAKSWSAGYLGRQLSATDQDDIQNSQYRLPSDIPDAGTVAQLYYGGWIRRYAGEETERIYTAALRMNGVFVGSYQGEFEFLPGRRRVRAILWQAWRDFVRSIPSIDMAMSAVSSGIIGSLLWRGLVEKNQGIPEVWEPFIELGWNWLSPQEARDALYRGIISRGEWNKALSRNRLMDNRQREVFEQLGQVIPGPSDLIRYAIREAFRDEKTIKDLGLDNELEQNKDFLLWAKAAGIGDVKAKIDGREIGMNVARMEWRAHWHLPSPEQVYEMLHRLRPDQIKRYQFDGLNPKPVTVEDARLLLKAADYPDVWRDRLLAINTRAMGKIEIRQAVRIGAFGSIVPDQPAAAGEPAAYAESTPAGRLAMVRFRDLGSDPETAKLQADTVVRMAIKATRRRTAALTLQEIRRGWLAGAIGDGQATALINDAKLEGVDAGQEVLTWRTHRLIRDVERAVRAIRGRLFGGIINVQQARAELRLAQVHPEHIDPIIRQWTIEFTPRRRELSAGNIGQAFKDAVISGIEAARRLALLGYQPADSQLLLAVWQGVRGRAALRAQLAAARSEESRREKLIRAAKQAQQEAQRLRRAACGKASKSQLLRWLGSRLASESEVRARLRCMAEKEVDIDRYIQEATAGNGG